MNHSVQGCIPKFLIPGRSLLIPILINYITSILPSIFKANKIDYKV